MFFKQYSMRFLVPINVRSSEKDRVLLNRNYFSLADISIFYRWFIERVTWMVDRVYRLNIKRIWIRIWISTVATKTDVSNRLKSIFKITKTVCGKYLLCTLLTRHLRVNLTCYFFIVRHNNIVPQNIINSPVRLRVNRMFVNICPYMTWGGRNTLSSKHWWQSIRRQQVLWMR